MASKGSLIIGGGTGFIGKHLGELFLSDAYKVINVSRMPSVNNISWLSLESNGLPKNTKAVVNCAGQQTMDFTKAWTSGFKQNVWNSRVKTTEALALAINKASVKPEVFVVITGVGAYEPSDHKKYDENSPITGTDFFSKLLIEWEKAAKILPPVRLVVIRSGVVLGRAGGMIKNMYMPFYLGLGGPIGNGKQYMPWIHYEDLIGIVQYAINNKEVNGILNGVAPQVVTNGEFTKAFAKALQRPAFFPVPEFLLNFALNPERAMLMTKGQHVTPKRVLEYGYKYRFPNIDVACESLANDAPKNKNNNKAIIKQ